MFVKKVMHCYHPPQGGKENKRAAVARLCLELVVMATKQDRSSLNRRAKNDERGEWSCDGSLPLLMPSDLRGVYRKLSRSTGALCLASKCTPRSCSPS